MKRITEPETGEQTLHPDFEKMCAGPGALPTTWTTVPVTSIKSPVTISNLKPGATYVFQACAVVNGGYSDYGDAIARIVV